MQIEKILNMLNIEKSFISNFPSKENFFDKEHNRFDRDIEDLIEKYYGKSILEMLNEKNNEKYLDISYVSDLREMPSYVFSYYVILFIIVIMYVITNDDTSKCEASEAVSMLANILNEKFIKSKIVKSKISKHVIKKFSKWILEHWDQLEDDCFLTNNVYSTYKAIMKG